MCGDIRSFVLTMNACILSVTEIVKVFLTFTYILNCFKNTLYVSLSFFQRDALAECGSARYSYTLIISVRLFLCL